MWFFGRHKKTEQKAEPVHSGLDEMMQKNSATAVEYAKSLELALDYSENSLKGLEQILRDFSENIAKSTPPEDQLWSMALIFGAYLGEVLLKNGLSQKGYGWGTDNTSDIPLLVADTGLYIAPVDKAYKRLVNGAEDNVCVFYEITMNGPVLGRQP